MRKIRKFFYEQFYLRFISPQHKWLTDKLGLTWLDKDDVIEIALFESMIHFWESENGEASMRVQYEYLDRNKNPEEYQQKLSNYQVLQECYTWAKIREQVWEDFWDAGLSPELRTNSEDTLIAQDTHVLCTIVKMRKHLWT